MPAKATSTWPEPHDKALRVAVEAGCSFSQAAKVLNDLFGTNYTRNAAIGRANRLGLCQPKREARPAKPKREPPRKVAPKPKPLPAPQAFDRDPVTGLRVADVWPLHLDLQDLTAAHCHWPYGDGPFTFCGCQAFEGGPYCEPHAALSIGAGNRREQHAHLIPRAA